MAEPHLADETILGAEEFRVGGYTLNDLHRLACWSVNNAFSHAADYHDRHDAAWFAIVEHLYSSPDAPTERDLVHTGRTAVDDVTRDERRHHGTARYDSYAGTESGPNFLRFWWWQTKPAQSCETRVVEQFTLAQIWPRLSATHREVLLALAVHDNYDLAAASLGKTYATFRVHVANARKQFLMLWHEGEAPSRVWGTDRRVARRGDQHAQRDSVTRVVRRRQADQQARAAS